MKIIALNNNFNAQQADGSVFLMADSSLAKSGKPWFLPDFADSFTYHTHIVFRIGRLGKNISRRFAHRYIDAVTIGTTVTAHGVNGAFCNAFDGAAMIGDFIPIEDIGEIADVEASLTDNGKTICFRANQMATQIEQIIENISKYFTLKIGDIIYAGYGDLPNPIAIGNHLIGAINNREVLNIRIK
ncbi:MAG: fumarylacetoacetate hydrolase family protein [Muribaculaceae bacterium]